MPLTRASLLPCLLLAAISCLPTADARSPELKTLENPFTQPISFSEAMLAIDIGQNASDFHDDLAEGLNEAFNDGVINKQTPADQVQTIWQGGGSGNLVAASDPEPKTYYIYLEDKQEGPFNKVQIKMMLSAGRITSDTYGWKEGLPDWTPISDIIE